MYVYIYIYIYIYREREIYIYVNTWQPLGGHTNRVVSNRGVPNALSLQNQHYYIFCCLIRPRLHASEPHNSPHNVGPVLHHTMLCHAMLYSTPLHSTPLYYIILYYTILYHVIILLLYGIVLHHMLWSYIISYHIILYLPYSTPSEIDVGLCLAVFAGSGGKYLFHRIGWRGRKWQLEYGN